ncbi:MAG: hypothetical protein CMO01_10665 [Thalassobius sp.]|nr:hypothetical protein [Thalassovita sp.]
MKKHIIYLWVLLMGLSINVFAQQSSVTADTVIINFGRNGSKMIFYLQNTEDVNDLENINFEELMSNVATYVDSAHYNESGYLEVNDDMASYKVEMPWKDEKDDDKLTFVRRPDTFISIEKKDKESWKRRTHQYMNFDLGLSGYFDNGSIPQNTDYETRPWGSRYISVNLMSRTRLSKQTKKAFYFKCGMTFSWTNFMFENNVQLIKTGDEISFEPSMVNLEKSKLTVSYVNLPVMFQYYVKNKFKISAGAYAGYRLGSYTKIKYNDEGDTQKDHDRGNYNLEPFRYGVRGEIGWGWFTLFANYDLNPLFTKNNTVPELHAFNFGIRL